MTDNRKKTLLGGFIAAEVICAALAWRDLGRRSDGEVRGKKRFWRAFIILNPGNSLVYWIFGRRPLPAVAPGRGGTT